MRPDTSRGPPATTFANAAAAFELWLLAGTDEGAEAARACLIRLLELYRAGLHLPSDRSLDADESQCVERFSDQEWRRAFDAAKRLPLDLYSKVFDPAEVPAEAPVVGSLADDLADVYRDVVTGLREYDRGNRAEAIWQWSFCLRTHWGAHATAAIRALHEWLSRNAPDRLSDDRAG